MEKAKQRNKPFAKLDVWIRDTFDIYKGHNPFKRLLHHLACRMWDFHDARDFDLYFLNKRKTQINDISFPRYLFMSLFFKTESASQCSHELDVKTITNEQIIELFPSKAEREYLTKINWQFSDRDREILYHYLALDEEPAYENDYVTIPFPFRSGDLVYVIGKENHIGVFCSCKDDQDFFDLDNQIKSFADWTDAASTRVEFLEPNGWFNHSHPQAFNLEYAQIPEDAAKDNPYYSALLITSELIRGTNSSIECLQMYCKEYSKKNAKKHKLLKRQK